MTMLAEPDTEPEATEDAPYGFLKDSQTGEWRPRKTRGRQVKADTPLGTSPPLEVLKAGKDTGPGAEGDVAPGATKKAPKTPKGDPIPPYRAGVIAKGMTVLYQRAGKLIRAWDRDIGQTVIDCAEDCGSAWDDLAKVNPRIRRALMKMIKGGAMGQILMAHAPIGMAIIMKDGIRERLPLMKLFNSMAEPDAGTGPAEQASPMTAGLTQEDMAQAMALAQQQMAQMGFGPPAERAGQAPPRAPEPPAPPPMSPQEYAEKMRP